MKTTQPIIDCDVHCNPTNSNPLTPFIPARFKTAIDLHMAARPTHGYANPFGVNRRDIPGLLPEDILKNHVDRYNLTYAILQPAEGLTYSLINQLDVGNALCQAINDWTLATCLEKDPRFLGSICVNMSDPKAAAAEIRRVANHPQIVQINIAGEAPHLYGHRSYDPIYEACEEFGLIIAIHPGAEGSLHASTPVGRPSSYFEWHVGLPITFMAHAASLIIEGTFEKFPGLRVLLTEGGYGWVPHLMWRMDKDFKALRATTPWLREEPSAYLKRHIRLTTQPVEEAPNPRHALALLEIMEGDKMLCFSSDFPHWDFDDPFRAFPSALPEEAKQRILWKNAAQFYDRRLPAHPHLQPNAPSHV